MTKLKFRWLSTLAVVAASAWLFVSVGHCAYRSFHRTGLGPPGPPAIMSVAVPGRWESSPGVNGERSPDTLRVLVSITFESPCVEWQGEWRVLLPEGLEHVSGSLGGSGVTSQIKGVHEIRARRTRWGTFPIRAHFKTGIDSLNWTSHDLLVDVRTSPDYFASLGGPPPEYGIRNWKHVLGGLHYRRMGSIWIPLDPGEDEAVEHGFAQRLHKELIPATHKASAKFAQAAESDSAVQVPILVAVNRAGLVKDAYTPNTLIPRPILDSAVVAARKWRFVPAMSLGRPVSALYSIEVPVSVPAQVYADVRKRNRWPDPR